MTAMTVTYSRPPKRQRPPKPPQPALTAAVVTTRKRGPKPPADNPEGGGVGYGMDCRATEAARHLMG
jgi:hypothetical protein